LLLSLFLFKDFNKPTTAYVSLIDMPIVLKKIIQKKIEMEKKINIFLVS